MMGFLYEHKMQETYKVNSGRHHMKSLSIIPFTLEINRAVSVLCLLASESAFRSQAVGNTINFGSCMDKVSGML
jgi:hypothetical protein